jgi:4a-hydroxytetrahydrobiopterin dehydratase
MANALPNRASLLLEHCRVNAAKMDDGVLAPVLKELTGWTRNGDAITRSYKFADFFHTMAFVNAVASVAHREDHHPDLAVSYNRCDVTFSTHSAGGLTRNDLICAVHVDALQVPA